VCSIVVSLRRAVPPQAAADCGSAYRTPNGAESVEQIGESGGGAEWLERARSLCDDALGEVSGEAGLEWHVILYPVAGKHSSLQP
jgi:hypothetical protein